MQDAVGGITKVQSCGGSRSSPPRHGPDSLALTPSARLRDGSIRGLRTGVAPYGAQHGRAPLRRTLLDPPPASLVKRVRRPRRQERSPERRCSSRDAEARRHVTSSPARMNGSSAIRARDAPPSRASSPDSDSRPAELFAAVAATTSDGRCAGPRCYEHSRALSSPAGGPCSH